LELAESLGEYGVTLDDVWEVVELSVNRRAGAVAEALGDIGLSDDALAAVLLASALQDLFKYAYVRSDRVAGELDKVEIAMRRLGYAPVEDECEKRIVARLASVDWDISYIFAYHADLEYVVIDSSGKRLALKRATRREQG